MVACPLMVPSRFFHLSLSSFTPSCLHGNKTFTANHGVWKPEILAVSNVVNTFLPFSQLPTATYRSAKLLPNNRLNLPLTQHRLKSSSAFKVIVTSIVFI